ncbi:hypothetical protein INR49_011293, partial [Caranx melampygus]
RIVRLLHHNLCLLPFKPFNGRRSLGALNQKNSPKAGDPWGRTMCTTMMVLTTIALILRQRFSNKIRPCELRPGWAIIIPSAPVASAFKSCFPRCYRRDFL